MPTLTNLLLSHQVATYEQVEQALLRQSARGGDILTNLAEVVAFDEAKALEAYAKAEGMEAMPAGPLPTPPQTALDAIPAHVALSESILPLRSDNGKLEVAVAHPISAGVLAELDLDSRSKISQRLALPARVAVAVAIAYGRAPDERMAKALAHLTGQRAESDRPAVSHPEEHGKQPPVLSRGPTSKAPSGLYHQVRVPNIPPRGDESSLQQLAPEASERRAEGREASPTKPLPAAPSTQPHESTATTEAAPVESAAASASVQQSPSAEQQPLLASSTPAPRKNITNHKGPLTTTEARLYLEHASSTSETLRVFFTFARQFFAYTAVFIVRDNLAEGWDSFGPGADREAIRGIGVPLDMPSLLETATRLEGPVLRPPAEEGIDEVLRRDLRRPVLGRVLVLPVVLRHRTIALLWGDDADQNVSASLVADVLTLTPFVSAAIERLLLQKRKNRAKRGSKTHQTDARVENARSNKSTLTGMAPVNTTTVLKQDERTAAAPVSTPRPHRSDEQPTSTDNQPGDTKPILSAVQVERAQTPLSAPPVPPAERPANAVTPREPDENTATKLTNGANERPPASPPNNDATTTPQSTTDSTQTKVPPTRQPTDDQVQSDESQRQPSNTEPLTTGQSTTEQKSDSDAIPQDSQSVSTPESATSEPRQDTEPPTVASDSESAAKSQSRESSRNEDQQPEELSQQHPDQSESSSDGSDVSHVRLRIPQTTTSESEESSEETDVTRQPPQPEQHRDEPESVRNSAPVLEVGEVDEETSDALMDTLRSSPTPPQASPESETSKHREPRQEQGHSVVQGPSKPPASYDTHEAELPSVMLNMDSEIYRQLDEIEAVEDSPSMVRTLRKWLLSMGPMIRGPLLDRFPGKIRQYRSPITGLPLPARVCGRVLELAALMIDELARDLRTMAESDEPVDKSAWALRLLAESGDPSSEPLVRRALLHQDESLRRAAADALQRSLGRNPWAVHVHDYIRQRLTDRSLSQDERVKFTSALVSLGQHRDIHLLLDLLDGMDDDTRKLIENELIRWTGRPSRGTADSWRHWWDSNHDTERFLRLLEGITVADDDVVRNLLQDELISWVGEDFGFGEIHSDEAMKDVLERYLDWWKKHGGRLLSAKAHWRISEPPTET